MHVIRVRNVDRDPRGASVLQEIRNVLGVTSVERVEAVKLYRFEGIPRDEAERLAMELLCDLLIQTFTIDEPVSTGNERREVAYKPGVMNPEVGSILKAAEDLKINLKAADSSCEYAFYGKLSEKDLNLIAKRLLVNETIERIVKTPPKSLVI